MAATPHDTASFITLDEHWGAHNYHPLPVVIAEAEGAWVTDVDGNRYLDFLSGYSALNFGHRHPALLDAARSQLDRLTLTSRAFHNDQFGAFCRDLAELTGTEMVLTMNTGAEAVESAIKVARKWAYEVKGVEFDRAEIIVAAGNFHGRTTTIVSFSDDPAAHDNYGPFTPGFITVPYGDLDAIRAAITPNTAAVLMEPIQGESGVIVPPAGFFAGVRELCNENNVLLVADEIQSGLARTGKLFALDHDNVRADLYTLGKALGGGIIPVSAVVGRADVLGVLKPGQHGSTFGGYPVACAVGRAVVELLRPASSRSVPRSSASTCTGGSTSWSARGWSPYAGAACGRVSTSTPPPRPGVRSRWRCAIAACSARRPTNVRCASLPRSSSPARRSTTPSTH